MLILESIRQPKRITIRGDDEKEYRFLVKGGEDLRLDQRVEQVVYEMCFNSAAEYHRKVIVKFFFQTRNIFAIFLDYIQNNFLICFPFFHFLC